jgi:hypothetical protein
MTLPVEVGRLTQAGTPVPAFPSKPVVQWRAYDVAADGRFLALVTESIGAAQPLRVRTNWPAARR